MSSRDAGSALSMIEEFEKMPLGQEKFQKLGGIFEFIAATTNFDHFKKAVDAVFTFQGQIPEAFREQIVTAFTAAFKELQQEKLNNGLKDQADYIETKLPKADKGF